MDLNSILGQIYAATQNHGGPLQAALAAQPAAPPVAQPPGQPTPVPVAPVAAAGVPPPQVSADGSPVPARPSIMKTLQELISPEAGSFWQQAMAHGLSQAKAGEQDYQQQQTERGHLNRMNQADEVVTADKLNDIRTGKHMFANGDVMQHPDASQIGSPNAATGKPYTADDYVTSYRAPAAPGETERLLSLRDQTAKASQDALTAGNAVLAKQLSDKVALIESAIKGYQYTSPVMAVKAANAIGVAKVRAAAAAAGRAAKGPKAPTGYILEGPQ